MQTNIKQLVARLRNEGSAVVLSIPLRVREQLGVKGGDLVVVSAQDGNLIARKVDLVPVANRMNTPNTTERYK